MKLQVLVNKVLRSLTGSDRDTPVSVLSSSSGKLSVQQHTAFFTINSVHRSLKSNEPVYSNLIFKSNETQLMMILTTPLTATWSTINFLSQDAGSITEEDRLYNQLPVSLIQSSNQAVFKRVPNNGFKKTSKFFHHR